jgi:hypothetical protein
MEEELQQQMTDALNDQVCEDSVQSVEDVISSLNSQEIYPDLKKGIKLPKSPIQWSNANDFFNSLFQTSQLQRKISVDASIP